MLVLRKELKRVEAIESFWAFVQDGVEHIRQNGGSARDPNDVKTTLLRTLMEVIKSSHLW